MKNTHRYKLGFLMLIFAFKLSIAQSQKPINRQWNPIIPGYFADPTVKQFGDTYYIYATTDGNGGGFGPSQVWTSKDFVNWTMQDMNWPNTHYYWAPDVTKGTNGRYYLYYCQPVEIFGASSDTPIGPWKSLLAPGKPVVSNFMVPNVITLDGQTFKDDDGKYYMYWGTWGIYPNHGCGVGLLNDDMKSFSKLSQIPNTDAKDFFEAPFVFKRKGIYYLTYSSGYCEDGTYRVQYAMATNPMGPFKYAKNNPILSTNQDGTIHGPGHQSVLQQGNDFYLIYHRHNNPHNDGGYHRQVAGDKIVFDEKGNIEKLIPTHSGIGYLAKNENPHQNLAFGCTATASSFYDKDFKPRYAVDDNNGTLWKPRNNVGSAWLQVDLGTIRHVKSVHTQFEYATWYYQYKVEYSVDGKTWRLYADRSKNTQHGSPMIDFGNVNARYVRTTILSTEYPGLNKAIWNMKVFDNASYHPAMNTKIQKWKSLKNFESKGLLVDLDLTGLRFASAVDRVPNAGKLLGTFNSSGSKRPIVEMIKGKKALIFSGQERMKSTQIAPSSLLGNSSYSVSMWVLNPEIAKEEQVLSWTGRGGVNLSNVTIGYGDSKNTGATTHLGWADLGYKKLPDANQWHLITMVFDGTMERIYVDGKLDRAERRMLFISNLTHFFVGGGDEGITGFSGAIASLKVYDIPLAANEVKTAYTIGIKNNISVYAEAKDLEYGNLHHWPNQGAALGELEVKGVGHVADSRGKIALLIDKGTKLQLEKNVAKPTVFLKPFTAIFTLISPPGNKININFYQKSEAIQVRGNGQWQHIVYSYDKGKFHLYIDGKTIKGAIVAAPKKDQLISIEALDAQSAISSIKLQNYGIDSNTCKHEFNYWKSTTIQSTDKPSFSIKPSALTPNMVYMVANKPSLPGIDFQYLFKRNLNSQSEKWLRSPCYVDFSVAPAQLYTYTLKVKDNYGNVTGTSLPAVANTDPSLFIIERQTGSAQANPASENALSGTSWNGFIGQADTLDQQSGVLTMVSNNTFWDGSKHKGPFAYQNVQGDFTAEVYLSDMSGLKEKKAYGANEAGLMVKASKSDLKLIQNGVMPGWGVGNIVTGLDSVARKQYNNNSGWSFHRYLQIQRIENTFFVRGSDNGKDWTDLPGSPMKRADMEGILEIGVYHATYGDQRGYASFSDFKIIRKK